MSLTYELVARIMGNVGIVPGPNYGKHGACLPTGKTILLEENSKEVEHIVYSAQLNIGTSIYHVMFSAIGADEFIMILSFDNDKYGFYMNHFEKEADLFKKFDNWQPVNILTQLNLAAGFEALTSHGYQWSADGIELFDEFVGFVDLFL